jgi:protein TonB
VSTASDPLLVPPRLHRRQLDGLAGRISRDRLSSMLVLAVLLHGLVLMGVTFTAPGGRGDAQRGLEVLLVSDELPEARENEDAAYVAQRSQEGSGNTETQRAAQLPGAPPVPPTPQQEQPVPDRFEDPLLSTAAPALSSISIEAVPEPELLLTQQELERLLAGDESLVLRGESREELFVSPDTRASRLAPYVNAWRSRVEQVGTLRFQTLVRQRDVSGSLLLEVVINHDGRLRRATIVRSSGNPQLDEAAREILRLASPFDPFPPDLTRDYRTLRFAYEWVFEGGAPAGSSVRLP